MKIKLIKEYEKRAVNTVLDVPDGDAAILIKTGHAEKYVEPAPVPAANAETNIAEIISKAVGVSVGEAIKANMSVARPEVVRKLAIHGGPMFAEPAETKSFGEYLQCLSYVALTNEPGLARKSAEILTGKYESPYRPNFNADWEHGAKGFGGINMEDVRTKASPQAESVGATGGFGVPVEYSNQLYELVGDYSFLWNRVTKYPMTALQMNIPSIDYSKGGSGASPYLGGMIAGWTAEGGAFPQTNLSLREIELKANLLSGYTVASRQLLADNKVGLERVFTGMFAKTIAYYVDYAILLGSGANQPLGILNAPASIAAARTGDTSNGSTLADLATIYSDFLPEAASRGIWVVAPSFKSRLIQMNDKSGRVVYLPNFPNPNEGPAARPMPINIFALSTFVSQLAASAGSKGDVYLIDPESYAFGMRQEIEIGVSEHVNWLTNQLTYRFLFRGDGQPLLNTYLTLQNNDTVSPFVFRNTIQEDFIKDNSLYTRNIVLFSR